MRRTFFIVDFWQASPFSFSLLRPHLVPHSARRSLGAFSRSYCYYSRSYISRNDNWRCLQRRLAPGYDKVPIRVIKDSLPNIVSTLTRLINLSFASNTFPQAWKKAKVIPHPKEGDHELPNNNRPISLLPAGALQGIGTNCTKSVSGLSS